MNKLGEDAANATPQAAPPNSPLSAILKPISRRDFLRAGGIGTLGILIPQIVCVPVAAAAVQTIGEATAPGLAAPDAAPLQPPEANAKGMVIAEPTRCTGCRRCELACTEFNDGKAQPSIARVKVGRNLNFGPQGAQLGFWRGDGQFGNFRVVQDTCRQCGHPIPCASVCPAGAIEVTPPTNARVVNVSKCIGCRQCQAACPWGMTSFDEALQKATKCTLCNGSPECVKACPTGALQYVPWEDKSRDIPVRWTVPAYLSTPPSVAGTCSACHYPGK